MKRIVFLHYRVGRTDGVSLQIDAWCKILKRHGFSAKTCSGPLNIGADYVIDGLEHEFDPKVFKLNKAAFEGGMSEDDFNKEFDKRKQNLKIEFKKMLETLKPNVLWVSNMLSVGEHLPAAAALSEVINETGIRTIAIHHDFYWENKFYDKPAYPRVKKVLAECLLPKLPTVTHVCINSIAQKELLERRKITSSVLPDTLDFSYLGNDRNGACKRELGKTGIQKNDLIVVQGTRIVRRKNIEIAIDFISNLQEKISKIGKKRVVLVMAGYAEKKDEWYRDLLVKYAKSKKVNVRLMPVISFKTNSEACGLYDVYRYADLITYPSEYEGFGNQFLEAVRAKKPVVMFEYPVFIKDIKPQGFEIISLGSEVTHDSKSGLAKIEQSRISKAIEEAFEILTDIDRKKIVVERNFLLGKLNYGYDACWQRLERLLDKMEN